MDGKLISTDKAPLSVAITLSTKSPFKPWMAQPAALAQCAMKGSTTGEVDN